MLTDDVVFLQQTLSRALEALDENHRGLLPRQEVAEAMHNAFQEISQRQEIYT